MRGKYLRTSHLPWSPGATSDDERLVDVSAFVGREVVVTEKMDGECTTIRRDGCHARSLDTAPHQSRTWVRGFAGRIRHLIPDGVRVVGENLFAEHSVHYSYLPSYFLAFAVHADDVSLSWDEVVRLEGWLGVHCVPVLYQGSWDEKVVRACWTGTSRCGGAQEGYVVRLAGEFPIAEHGRSVAKFVRAGHVQTDERWLSKPVVKNRLLVRE